MIRAVNQMEMRRAKEREAANRSKGILMEDAIKTKKAIIAMYEKDLEELFNYRGVRPSHISADIADLTTKINRHRKELDTMESTHGR